MRRNPIKAILGLLLSLSIFASSLPGLDSVVKSYAVSEKQISGLGTGTIENPTNGETGGLTEWTGYFVYYGKFDRDQDASTPADDVKYRVLSKATSDFGGTTMLLDCDQEVAPVPHHNGDVFEDGYAYRWENSYVKTWLNGDYFYTNESILTARERTAISASTKGSPSVSDGSGTASAIFEPLTGQYIFVLDAKEVTNSSYGYKNRASGTDYTKLKLKFDATENTWWTLRSSLPNKPQHFIRVQGTNSALTNEKTTSAHGICPAFNIDLSYIIFSSLIADTEYKLTIKDDNLGVDLGTVIKDGDTITVPYTITGSSAADANRLSVLITDSAYSAGSAVTSGFTYLKLAVDTWDTSGSGTFTLPSAYANKTLATDYHVYILAEDVNGEKETDYASTPVEITQFSAPTPSSTDLPVTPTATDAKQDPASVPGSESKVPEVSSKPSTTVTPDYIVELNNKLDDAIETGKEQTVTWNQGTSLSYDVMKTLEDNPKLTLEFSYTYQGKDYKVTISGKDVKANPGIPWYGPVYLYTMFGGTRSNSKSSPSGNNTYVVISGDTLSKIARELKMSVNDLATINNISNPDLIYTGQILKY